MKINLSEDCSKNGLISHIVIEGITTSTLECLAAIGKTPKGVVCDLILTANGHEIDIEKFVKVWEDQIDEMLAEKAKEIIADKFRNIADMLTDLEERIEPEIKKRLEDWEK